MKKSLFIITILACFTQIKNSTAQETQNKIKQDTVSCMTVGILNGGGGLLGIDLELIFGKRIGIQGGAGFFSYGASINYHLKPSIRSSFISLSYMHQGFGESFFQSMVGPSFVYRSKKWFTAQLGFASVLQTGPALEKYMQTKNKTTADYTSVILTYSIGVYFFNH